MAARGTTPGHAHGAVGSGEPVRVLAVDDQAIFLRTLRQLIAATPGFEQVGEARSGEEALERATALRPDLVLLDVRMPGLDGVETARRLLAEPGHPTVVLISLDPLPEQQTEILQVGAAAFVRKQELSVRRLVALWAEHRSRATAELDP
jgi:DNA-binding NarL/FixJ family response regulator